MKISFLRVLMLLIFLCTQQASYSQTEKELTFVSSDPNITLAATLTKPSEHKIKAAVVLLPVAGPTDRDLSLGNHKYYKALADGLAEHGIASIRYDDRGVGQSGGVFLATDLKDRTLDACEALIQLRSEFPYVKTFGFIGMSEGAGISVLTSRLCDSGNFIILLSLPVREGKIEMKDQMNRLLATSFFTNDQKEQIKLEAAKFLEVASATNSETKRDEILNIMNGKYGSVILPPYQFVPKTAEEKTDFVLSPWYQSQLNYNIQEAFGSLKIPSLAIYGNLDQAIDPIVNASLLKELSPKTDLKALDSINHLMQKAKVGSPIEYIMLPDSFSSEVIEIISSWIKEQINP